MTLESGKGQAALSRNIATEVNAGKPQDQAAAIAYSKQGQDADKGNQNHSKENGQFTSGTSSAPSVKILPPSESRVAAPNKFLVKNENAPGGYTAHATEEEALQAAGKGRIPALFTVPRQDDSDLHDLFVKNPEGKWEKHSSGKSPNGLLDAFKAKHNAKDAQPDMALDPNSAAVNSPTPWKGRNLDNDPVGDRSGSPDVATAGGGDCSNTWNGRTLD